MPEFDKLQKQFPEIVMVRGCWRQPEVVLSHDIDQHRKEEIKKALKAVRNYWEVGKTKFIIQERRQSWT